MSKFPTLRTERLLLRGFEGSDAQAIFDAFSRDSVTKYYNRESMQSIEEAEKLVESRASLFKSGIGIRWGIALIDKPGVVIGSCGYYKLNQAYASVEIGFDLHPTYWRRGIMTEALTAAIDHGYGDAFFFRLNRIQALTYPENEASINLLKKLGFQEEGIRRECGYWKGQFHDLASFSLLRRDWAQR
jgi:ribosomal-protein-alanine N-acetyltransferase